MLTFSDEDNPAPKKQYYRCNEHGKIDTVIGIQDQEGLPHMFCPYCLLEFLQSRFEEVEAIQSRSCCFL